MSIELLGSPVRKFATMRSEYDSVFTESCVVMAFFDDILFTESRVVMAFFDDIVCTEPGVVMVFAGDIST